MSLSHVCTGIYALVTYSKLLLFSEVLTRLDIESAVVDRIVP